jgi:hypothetical protein
MRNLEGISKTTNISVRHGEKCRGSVGGAPLKGLLSPFLPHILSKGILAATICLVSCSSTENAVVPADASVAGPVVAEKNVFKSASAFFCEKLRWPSSWQELVEYHSSTSGESEELLPGFGDPTLCSSRAILLTMSYKNQVGAQRAVTFIAPPYCGDASERDDTREVSIAGGGVRFRLPEGFRLMKGADVKAYWKAPPYPDAAWMADDGRLIAIRFGDIELSAEQTEGFLHDLTEAYEASVPSIQWRVREVQVLGDRAFLRHEFENSSSKGRLANVVLSSSFGGFLFAITATGPADHTTAVLEAAGEIEDSLKVR